MRVAIANRGEVAVRIIRTCQEMGFVSILLHSTPDKDTLAYRLADETVELAGESALDTYLNISKVVGAAVHAKAKMVHPGFGFLSENAAFAAALAEAGLIFVGPTPQAIELAGHKIKAKELAKAVGVPTVSACVTQEKDPKKLLAEVKKIGFPCLVKAASGGGGKGMKVVHQESEFFEQYASAQREAQNAFGDSTVFIEKYLAHPRHIEVQVLGDAEGRLLHFFERECSIQRRHQKIFEETPSPALTPDLRDQITAAALKIAEAAGYSSAGTVEFLLDEKNNFYFMELNTRLQVEHTVTEMVCGVDFAALQFAVAQNKPLALTQEDVAAKGHALEVRIYAEDPEREFLPSTGEVAFIHLPFGPHRRFDFGYGTGDKVNTFYDPMIGKVITWAPTRLENIARMHATLSELVIFGVNTNIEFLKRVLGDKDFQAGRISTRFLEEKFKGPYSSPPLTPRQKEFAKLSRGVPSASGAVSAGPVKLQSPWVSS